MMRKMRSKGSWFKRESVALALACALIADGVIATDGAQSHPMPHLRQQGTATQLIVDGKPFLVLGGELGNSSSSSLEYMRPIWPKLVSLNLNTVLVPVYWELIEPTEGTFDFSLVDGLIQAARQHRLRLVPLWFASWKNSMSCYAPAWVKTNQQRFPRAEDKAGRGMEILSPFSQENVEADARAFAAFMRHVRDVDSRDHTVIMVQVENEIGMIPDSRDHSAIADKLFHQPVPPELMSYLEQRKDALIPEFRAVPGNEIRFGTSGRNILRGPGYFNLDVSLYRNFTITERVTLQFRAEMFGATNTPHYGNPGTDVTNTATFGVITGTLNLAGRGTGTGGERQVWFGARVIF
jgi:hypothetical protein